MIYKKYWHGFTRQRDRYNYMGIFLLGFIPLYIKRSDKI
jgi:hypothetical protein